MKEFVSQTGGRYTYIDDIMNLQELSLAFSHVFEGCGNFVISGCEVSGTTINPGFVFINGKLRYCAGTTDASKWPMYIYESNKSEKVSYVDALDKVGREVYGCALGSVVPVINDALTGKLPQFIKIEKDGSTTRLKDAFFGKYSLLLDPSKPSQTVKKPVVFGNEVNMESGMIAKKQIGIHRGNSDGSLYISDAGELVFQLKTTHNTVCKLVITDTFELRYYVNDELVTSFNQQENYIKQNVASEKITGGNLSLFKNDLYNENVSTDEACLNINMLGYHGGNQFFRNTNIGDGKNNVIVGINGKTKKINVNGEVNIKNNGATLTLTNQSLINTDQALTNYIRYCDKNLTQIATIGFVQNNNFDFYIRNNLGDVVVDNDTYINGTLVVNGKSVLGTLVDKDEFNAKMNKKANSIDVYSKTVADDRFVKTTDGISIFVNNAGGKNAICAEIGACTKEEHGESVQKSKNFNDIVSYGLPSELDVTYTQKLEDKKRALCDAIGAVCILDINKEPRDTGWVETEIKNCGIITKIYIRQVGSVVSIQGEVHTHHSGTIFTIPNFIDPPKYKIGYSHNKSGQWHCVINGGQRDCVVDYCSGGCSEYIGFLMTYLV